MEPVTQLTVFKEELNAELYQILDFWAGNTLDTVNGGFYGRIDNDNKVDITAPKGSVLNARILWTFSAAYNLTKDERYLSIAQRAYQYIAGHFIDEEFGGVYWSVGFEGNPQEDKKQVYAIAFTIYGLSEYYLASGVERAKEKAILLYMVLVDRGYDHHLTGYLEAFTRNWQPMADLRLSSKDFNEKKTMNTHLHVVEAYANLYKIWPDGLLKLQIEGLLENFTGHFIDQEMHRLILFFDEKWHAKSNLVSYGHDIEASWLLQETAEAIGNTALIEKFKMIGVEMAAQVIEGLDVDGGLWYEFEPDGQHLVKEKHWWVQAEAMVGFFNAWQIAGDDKYLEIVLRIWELIKNKLIDKQYGEWFWGIDSDGRVMRGEDKVGMWKCPYHNGRGCMEIIKRLDRQNKGH